MYQLTPEQEQLILQKCRERLATGVRISILNFIKSYTNIDANRETMERIADILRASHQNLIVKSKPAGADWIIEVHPDHKYNISFEPPPPPPTRLQEISIAAIRIGSKMINSNWTITIVGGIIAAVIGGIILYEALTPKAEDTKGDTPPVEQSHNKQPLPKMTSVDSLKDTTVVQSDSTQRK